MCYNFNLTIQHRVRYKVSLYNFIYYKLSCVKLDIYKWSDSGSLAIPIIDNMIRPINSY